MKKNLLEIINNHFLAFKTDTDDWQYVLENCGSIPSCMHLLNMVEYYVAYYKNYCSINLSIVLYDKKKAVGIMPLIAHKNQDKQWILSSNGIELVEPIFDQNLGRKVKKKLEIELIDLIFTLAKKLNIQQCQFVNTEFFRLSSWYLMLTEKANESFATHHILVDLSLSIHDIRLNFRKSFKPFINKGLKEWIVEVHEQVTIESFEQFRLFHKSVAGRSTRSIDSWNIQKKQIDFKESFIVYVKGENNILVGAGLFTYSRDNGFYSVGAYKRDLSDKPLGHVVQMKAIETFKKNGVKWYEIGLKHLLIDKIPPTKKQLTLTHFREGFATHVAARQHLIAPII